MHTNVSRVTVKTFTMLQKICISNKCSKKNPEMYYAFKKIISSTTDFNINKQIGIISEGSCDTEDWSNDAENSAAHHRNILNCNNISMLLFIQIFFIKTSLKVLTDLKLFTLKNRLPFKSIFFKYHELLNHKCYVFGESYHHMTFYNLN